MAQSSQLGGGGLNNHMAQGEEHKNNNTNRGRGTRSKHIGLSNPHTSTIHIKIHTPQEVSLVVPSPSTTRRGASPSMIGERKVGGDSIRKSSLSPAGDGRRDLKEIYFPKGKMGAKLSSLDIILANPRMEEGERYL